jgi:hypothetical protein
MWLPVALYVSIKLSIYTISFLYFPLCPSPGLSSVTKLLQTKTCFFTPKRMDNAFEAGVTVAMVCLSHTWHVTNRAHRRLVNQSDVHCGMKAKQNDYTRAPEIMSDWSDEYPRISECHSSAHTIYTICGRTNDALPDENDSWQKRKITHCAHVRPFYKLGQTRLSEASQQQSHTFMTAARRASGIN